MASMKRVVLTHEAFSLDRKQASWERGRLDASFIQHPNSNSRPFFAEYRLHVDISEAISTKVHVTADERYQLFLDGNLVGRGAERGDAEHWFYETYALELEPGKHEIKALVWSLGPKHMPHAQFSIQHGFLLISEDERLSTGKAPWKTREIKGIEMIPKSSAFAVGDRFRFKGEDVHGQPEWVEPIKSEKPTIEGANDVHPLRLLRHATLPPMMSHDWKQFVIRNVSEPQNQETANVKIEARNDIERDHQLFVDLLAGNRVTIPANTRRRVIVDCEDYLCSYWHLKTIGGKGSLVRIHWQESLYEDLSKSIKGNRNEVEGKYFAMVWSKLPGNGDEIFAGGGDESYSSIWWLAGRYLEMYIETKEDPLTVEGFRLEETRYPLEPVTHPFRCNDPKLNRVADICLRGLQADLHETYCDSPYYEQLMYTGDTRIEAMMTMAIIEDTAAPRKATQMFQWSIGSTGFTQSRYPSFSKQFIPTFSLWWVMMAMDQQTWRGDAVFVKSLLPGARAVLGTWLNLIQQDDHHPGFGLPFAPEYWNFVDWVNEWPTGVPPGGEQGYSIAIALQLLLAVEAMAELESLHGYAQSQRHFLAWAQDLRKAIKRHVLPNGLLRDAIDTDSTCEQVHALAVLTNDPEIRAIGAKWYEGQFPGYRATYYFQHYRLEALARLGKYEELLASIRKEWGSMVDNGLCAPLEQTEPSRSDCHAWSSHPLYHLQSKILGFSPLEAFRFEFKPNLCDLEYAEGYISTGKGPIHARVDRKGSGWTATLIIPDGVIVSIPAVKGMVVGPRTVTVDPD